MDKSKFSCLAELKNKSITSSLITPYLQGFFWVIILVILLVFNIELVSSIVFYIIIAVLTVVLLALVLGLYKDIKKKRIYIAFLDETQKFINEIAYNSINIERNQQVIDRKIIEMKKYAKNLYITGNLKKYGYQINDIESILVESLGFDHKNRSDWIDKPKGKNDESS